MHVTYAVSWQEPNGTLGSGRLELGTDALALYGTNGSADVRRMFPYRNMSNLRIARGSGDRLQGRPTLIVDLEGGGSLRVAGVAQPGIVSELATRLAELRHDRRLAERIAIVVPLKPGMKHRAASLLDGGPPFDPKELALESHEVFLTDREAVFVFEGFPTLVLERLAEKETLWAAGSAWELLVDGSLRYAERAYAWPD